MKLDEAVPRSKGGEEHDEASKKNPSPEVTKPESPIDLEKAPPTEATTEEKTEKTPPAAKGKNIAAGQGPAEKTPPKKTADPTQPGPSSPKSDDDDSFLKEDEEEKARKAHLAETQRLGRIREQQAFENRRMEERRLREEEAVAKLAAGRNITTQL